MKIIKGIFSYHGKSREAIFSLVVNLKQSCSVKWPYSQSFLTGKFLIDGNVQPEEQKRGDRTGSIFPQTLSLDFRRYAIRSDIMQFFVGVAQSVRVKS